MKTTNAPQLDQAAFENQFVDELRGEVSGNRGSRQVPGYHYSRVAPTPVADPHLLAWADELGDFLGLARPAERGPAVAALAGNLVTGSMKPFAARYGGHQFGNWAGQLGDGRAISLGQVAAADGTSWEIQLKGAGPTPYSRRGDGRAVLRSSLREFLCSEAMHYLGVPTTRALSLVATGDAVVRDMFYSGDARPEPGAIVARVAPTFIRFGHFEILADRREVDNLRALADYTLRHHYPELGPPSADAYVRMFEEVCRRTAVMISRWMTVGFVHGVMNTDNMSILGVSIDYGPYGWLEPFDPDWTPNTTDFDHRRYTYGQQPGVGLWNLARLAQALIPLVGDADQLVAGLDGYRETYLDAYRDRFRAKLGLSPLDVEVDPRLIEALTDALGAAEADLTLFCRGLGDAVPTLMGEDDAAADSASRALIDAVSYATAEGPGHAALLGWLGRYRARLRRETIRPEAIRAAMHGLNPLYVPRNYLAQEAIEEAEAGDTARLEAWMNVLKRPYDEQPGADRFAGKRPEWARTRPGCATLSCSS